MWLLSEMQNYDVGLIIIIIIIIMVIIIIIINYCLFKNC